MEKKYSVVFHPSQDGIEIIKKLKLELFNKIGWYGSCNSVAHITIGGFKASENQLEKFIQKLSKIADTLIPIQIYLDHFDAYEESRAFFISPNEDSKVNLKPMMKKIQETLLISSKDRSDDPHISIGRNLTPENIKIARDLFTTINMEFLCDAIILREFDPIKKQYFILEIFPFGSNPQPELIQGSLF
ncbi:2'-5' RNA ligase [Flavobacterium sp. Root935]|jgi:2'-5' RNA ligase|uniref:2'-5' RNA ligase family protein n=1 Tax=unclassified Flavobacterium TaxID=196869 RepID=UPI00070E4BAC|nr:MULTISPECIES: 2'-5' RNA ligase family protein [unclassified Flavobacterium]KRD61191.1 2'-5' RNA ligase [Flavobacterium sp. Root935]TDX09737.1 2'-5' RNA ligase [Flavobacterium sp. S87F.05.LMB.W.Kidney.N]